MKNSRISLVILSFWAIVLAQITYAGITGKISGFVKDRQNGEPLVGVNVIVNNTFLGATTDIDGAFFILNIPPGVYEVEVDYIGYKKVIVSNILVKVDLTTNLSVDMEEQIIDVGEVINVVAERPLIQKDLTSSSKITTSEEFENTPLETIQDVIQLTAGVTTDENNQMHVRGGRGGEVNYLVDGVAVMDPLYSMRGADINNNAVAEVNVITGGFSAEYGDAMSGIVNVVTKEGSDEFSGSFRYTTDYGISFLSDDWGEQYKGYPFADRSKLDFGYNRFEASLSGYMPGISRLKFFLSTEVRLTDDRNPTIYMMPHHEEEFYSAQFKTTYFIPDPSIKFQLSGFYNRDQQGNYTTNYRYWLDHYYSNSQFGKKLQFKMNHTISTTTFYEVIADYFRTERWVAVRQTDPDKNNYENWYQDYDYKRGAYPDISYNEYEQGFTDVFNPFGVPGLFNAVGDARTYQFRYTDTYTIKANLTSQVNKYNELKTGFELKQYEVRFFDNSLNYDPKPFEDDYQDNPVAGSFYIADKFEYEGIIINAGGRLEYFDSKAYKYLNPYDNTSEKQYAKAKWNIVPRLGISHPISETGVVFYNYGKFFQLPDLRYFFTGINSDLTRGNQILGDPDLNVEETTSYEVGYNQLITEDMALNITAFYKDITGLVQTRLVPAVPSSYYIQTNVDYANVRGFEISLNKRLSNNFGGTVTYTMQVARGTASDATEAYFDYYNDPSQSDPVTGGTRVLPRSDFYLDFDQRHTFNFSGQYSIPKEAGPKVFSIFPLQNTHYSVVYTLASGLPYSPEDEKGRIVGAKNSARLPWTSSFDLRFSKGFTFGEIKVNLFASIYNLFNVQNIIDVYPRTGLPDKDGTVIGTISSRSKSTEEYVPHRDLNHDGIIDSDEARATYLDARAERTKDPLNYGAPRIVRIGLELLF